MAALESIKEVDIDNDEAFKYILLEVTDKKGKNKKNIVRGYEWAQFHADIVDRVAPKFSELGVKYECLGGGRIKHNNDTKTIFVYGYSVGFGQADHKITVDILQKHYSNYPKENITYSNAGY